MTGWRGWASGRRPWLVGVLWLLALLGVYLWWWVAGIWPWSPWEDEYGIFVISAVPTLAGAIALYGVLPGMDWIDLQAVTHPHGRDTLAAGVIVVAFAGIPPLVSWLFEATDLYLRFVSETRLPPPPTGWFWIWGLEVGAVLGASCAMVGLLGRLLGPLTALMSLSALLTIQGERLAPDLIPRVNEPHSALSLGGAALTVALGLAAFRVSRSGVRPLIGRR